MCKQTSLKSRKTKRDIVMTLLGVVKRNKKGQPIELCVPGSAGRQYQVILRRKNSTIYAECNKNIAIGYDVCKGNSKHKTLCYHSMAAIEYSIRKAGFKGHWCESFEDAQKLHQMLDGLICQAKSWNGEGEAWILVTKENE